MPGERMLERPLRVVAKALREGIVDAQALAEQAISRHAAHGEALNAYVTWDPEKARAQADIADRLFALGTDLGPLQGIPVSIKDIYGVAGWPTYAGSPQRLPVSWEHEGPVVAALRRQLAVMMGKTSTVEFALGTLGVNHHWGTPRNPWDAKDHRVPGGSSGGAGVSLCEGSALVALGTDTGGSVRAPASMTGMVGLKTSHGRWSMDGIVPLSRYLDTPGILTRTVDDLLFAFPAIDPHGRTDPVAMTRRLRPLAIDRVTIGVCDAFFWESCSPGVAESVQAALEELTAAGARTRPVAVPQGREISEMHERASFAAPEFCSLMATRLPDWLTNLDAPVRARADAGRTMTAPDFLDRLTRRAALVAEATAHFDEVDVLACPTIPNTPPKLDEIADSADFQAATLLALRNTSVANLLDYCAITIPVALDAAGMPVGLQLMAPHGQDERLLTIAATVEAVLGTSAQRLQQPPMVTS